MQATDRTRNILVALVIVLVAAALVGATARTPAGEVPVAALAATIEAPERMVGTFTGEFDGGVPVYRLPPVAVTASRSAELATMAQEARIAAK